MGGTGLAGRVEPKATDVRASLDGLAGKESGEGAAGQDEGVYNNLPDGNGGIGCGRYGPVDARASGVCSFWRTTAIDCPPSPPPDDQGRFRPLLGQPAA